MRAGLLILICFLTASIGFAKEEVQAISVPIDRYLDEVLHMGRDTEYCLERDQNNQSLFLEKANPHKIDCGKPFDSNVFCANITRATGCRNSNCWNPQLHYTEDEKKRAFRTAKAVFRRLTTDPNIRAACCGSDDGCKSYFGNVRLVVLKGLSAEDQTGHHVPGLFASRIEASESKILGCENQECIERFFLHELGHACQHALNPPDLMIMTHICFLSGSSNPFFDATVGEKTRRCILGRLKKQASESSNSCRSSWAAEAFADTIFSAWRTRPGHWAWSCESAEDSLHAQSSVYLPCIFERSMPKQSICAD